MCAPPRFCSQLWCFHRYFGLFVIFSGLESTTLKPIYGFWANGEFPPPFPSEGSNCNVDEIQDVCDRRTFPLLWSPDISIFWQMTKGRVGGVKSKGAVALKDVWRDTCVSTKLHLFWRTWISATHLSRAKLDNFDTWAHSSEVNFMLIFKTRGWGVGSGEGQNWVMTKALKLIDGITTEMTLPSSYTPTEHYVVKWLTELNRMWWSFLISLPKYGK